MATITGSSGNDSLTGGNAADSIVGLDGNDTLRGEGGNDTIRGGAGNDLAFGGNQNDSILGEDGDDSLSGDAGNDTLLGGAGNDVLSGGDGNDSLYGEDGDDVLSGGAGADLISGGAGTDWAVYVTSNAAVNVDLTRSGAQSGGHAAGDTLSGIENVIGSAFNDTLTGDAAANTLIGGAGNDSIFGGSGNDSLSGDDGNDSLYGGTGDDTLAGGAGADLLAGGQGMDYADYSASNAAVSVNLSTWTASGGHATGDSLSGVDGLIGSAFDDTLIGFDLQSTSPTDWFTNIFYGGAGNDSLDGRGGDDSLFGGADNDTILGGAGRDVVSGDDGDDSLFGGDGADTLQGGAGDDTIYGGADADLAQGGAGDDSLSGDAGNDTLQGGAGDDTLRGGEGNDLLEGGADRDLIEIGVGEGTDTILGGESGSDLDRLQFSAGVGQGGVSVTFTGGEAGSYSFAGGGSGSFSEIEEVAGTQNDDVFDASAAAGGVVVYGGSGDDTLIGGAGADRFDGGDGNDVVYGGAGDDSLYGGAGDDRISLGGGADQVFGGDGDDSIVGGAPGATVNGGAGTDTLDLSGLGPLRVVYGGDGSGTVIFYSDPSRTTQTGTMTFTSIETVVPCFAAGTRIATPEGPRLVERIRPGDRVFTRDNGVQTVRWVGLRHVSRAEAMARPELAAVRIAPGALGEGMPRRALIVSPQHRVLLQDPRAELLFGEHEVLVPALHLVGRPGIRRLPARAVTYCHLLFDRHEILLSEGAWTESFQPGDMTLAGMDEGPRRELEALFPGLARGGLPFAAARRSLRGFEARLLA